jgi:hypothetical protein
MMIPDGVYDYDVLGHWNNDKFVYELQVHMSDRIKMLPFKHPLFKYEKINSIQSANEASCPCEIVGDREGVSRIFGSFSEATDRVHDFKSFSGVTKEKEVYLPVDKGTVRIFNTENSGEYWFKGDKMNGRWLLRDLPNIFDNEFIEGERMKLFWKPETRETNMHNKLENLKTMQSAQLQGEKVKLNSQFTSGISIASNSKDFEVTVAAEGTWVDKFGQKFTYTKDFIKSLFTSMNMQLMDGAIPIGVDKEHDKMDNGRMTELQLLDEPIAHIKGRGFFNGPIEDVNGASIDAELDAIFVDQFQSWFPVNGITKRVSLVANPACKVCFFTPKASG